MSKEITPLKPCTEEDTLVRYQVIVSLQETERGDIHQRCNIRYFFHSLGMKKFISMLVRRYKGFFTICTRFQNGLLSLHYVIQLKHTKETPEGILEKIKEYFELSEKFDKVRREEYHLVDESISAFFTNKEKEDFVILQHFIEDEEAEIIVNPNHPLYSENLELARTLKGSDPAEVIPFGYLVSADKSDLKPLNAYCGFDLRYGSSGYVVGVVVAGHHKQLINDFYQMYEKKRLLKGGTVQ